MDKGWYMKFSEHRKGSFLPRKMQQPGDSAWEKNRKANNSGNAGRTKTNQPPAAPGSSNKQEAGVWAQMPAKSARFLHWVGFDLNKGLPPPCDETTNALGFLGYDFFGRIVEKSIFLKNLAKAKEEDLDFDERTILLELETDEQLTKMDIENAIEDPDIKPTAMYAFESTGGAYRKPIVAQLYFGPGFEDRLEMELDEIVCGQAKRVDLPKEEVEIRQTEDKLFADIAAPPIMSKSLMGLFADDDNDNDDGDGVRTETKGAASSTPKQSKKKSSPDKEATPSTQKEPKKRASPVKEAATTTPKQSKKRSSPDKEAASSASKAGPSASKQSKKRPSPEKEATPSPLKESKSPGRASKRKSETNNTSPPTSQPNKKRGPPAKRT